VRIASSPVYLDTSALAKLYLSEARSDELEAALLGRRDLIVSDLALSELTSTVARCAREGEMTPAAATRVYRRALRDVTTGEFLRAELTGSVHREAERLLLGLGGRVALRAADALHLALAATQGARVLITFDQRMRTAVDVLGTFDLPE
jgi:predicted nucleic acid-binding protein